MARTAGPTMFESARTRTLFGGDRKAFGRRGFAQARGIEQARVDVLRFEHRIGFKDGFPAGAIGKHGQDHRGRDATATDYGLAPHFSGLVGKAGEKRCCIHDGEDAAGAPATTASTARLAYLAAARISPAAAGRSTARQPINSSSA